MNRDRIQRRDFPTGRRGYDPAAVDEHLRRVADAFEANAQPPAPTLSGATSEQVRQILEAAERSVAEVRADADREASAHVTRVQDAAQGLLAKLDELEDELGGLLGALRASGERLQAGLAELQAQVGGGAVPAPAAQQAPHGDAEPPGSEPPVPGPAVSEPPVSEPPVSEPPVSHPPVSAPPADEAGARLAALNMALGGSSRDETAAYLAEHFELADPEALLDDVFARAGR